MGLINIEYGSLASSETMNKNFNYLEQKINDTSDSIMTSISSLLSNIATINSRLTDVTELINETGLNASAKFEECKNKTKILVQKSAMVPHWNGCTAVTIGDSYSVLANGYLLIVPQENSVGSIKVNSFEFNIESSNLFVLPVKEDDVLKSFIDIKYAFFLPITEMSLEDF